MTTKSGTFPGFSELCKISK